MVASLWEDMGIPFVSNGPAHCHGKLIPNFLEPHCHMPSSPPQPEGSYDGEVSSDP